MRIVNLKQSYGRPRLAEPDLMAWQIYIDDLTRIVCCLSIGMPREATCMLRAGWLLHL